MSSAAQKVNTGAIQPPTRGGFFKTFRDDLQPLYRRKGFYIKVFNWLGAHAAFINQHRDQWGGAIQLAPGECSFSFRGLQEELAITLAEAKQAILFLEKIDLIRVVATATGSKAIFPEAAGWGACAKKCAKKRASKAKKDCTNSDTDSSTDCDTDCDTVRDTLSCEENASITDGYTEDNGDDNTDCDTVCSTDCSTDCSTVTTHFSSASPASPEFPGSNNAENASKNSLSADQGQGGCPRPEEEERDFYFQFLGKEKEVGDEFKKQFKQGVRRLNGNKDRLSAAIWMIYQVRCTSFKIDKPMGYFTNLISGKGEIGEPPAGWSPFQVHQVVVAPPVQQVVDSKTPAERQAWVAEQNKKLKGASSSHRSPAQAAEDHR